MSHLPRRSEGFGVCYADPEEFTDKTRNIRALAVHPDVQGQRFDAALVTSAEDYLRSKA